MSTPNANLTDFFKFAGIGVLGFVVDYLVLHLVTPGLGPHWGRLMSVYVAMMSTYALNRGFVFSNAARQVGLVRGWFKFAAANSVGALINFGAYITFIALFGVSQWKQLIGVALGSLCGLVFNYLSTALWVFSGRGEQQNNEQDAGN